MSHTASELSEKWLSHKYHTEILNISNMKMLFHTTFEFSEKSLSHKYHTGILNISNLKMLFHTCFTQPLNSLTNHFHTSIPQQFSKFLSSNAVSHMSHTASEFSEISLSHNFHTKVLKISELKRCFTHVSHSLEIIWKNGFHTSITQKFLIFLT